MDFARQSNRDDAATTGVLPGAVLPGYPGANGGDHPERHQGAPIEPPTRFRAMSTVNGKWYRR